MDANKYPFRDQIPLTSQFKIEVWHNADMTETRYRFCQVDVVDNSVWFVRAEFAFVGEFIDYMHDLKLDQSIF